MPRAISLEREREYQELSAFVDFYYTNVKGVDAANSVHPTNVLKQIVQQFGKSKALEGLRQATNDTLEELTDRPSAVISTLDSSLRSLNIVTISELRRRYASSYKRIVKRGVIRTETEYHLINGTWLISPVQSRTPSARNFRGSWQHMNAVPNPSFKRTGELASVSLTLSPNDGGVQWVCQDHRRSIDTALPSSSRPCR